MIWSDYSDDDFDGCIDDEEILERMTRVGKIGSGLGTERGAGEGMEGLVSVSGGNAISGSSDDGNASIGMEVELRDQRSESGSDSESVGDGDDGTDGGEGTDDNGNRSNDDSNGSDDDSNSSDDSGDDSSSSMIPTFSKNIGVDMSGKEPVDYYRLFISDHIIDDVFEETNQYGDQ